VYREAAILSDLNRKKEALAAAKRSLQLSEKANNADFIKLNKDLIQELSK
jgi:predicted RNA polymerase sigma factor